MFISSRENEKIYRQDLISLSQEVLRFKWVNHTLVRAIISQALAMLHFLLIRQWSIKPF
ncbi:hypothetical protein [Rubritalea tangerina]|uniref:hypothetical protein n=1 Tax=Rubritalea tangerina TaxID=430798 RepID=UPI00361E55B8